MRPRGFEATTRPKRHAARGRALARGGDSALKVETQTGPWSGVLPCGQPVHSGTTVRSASSQASLSHPRTLR